MNRAAPPVVDEWPVIDGLRIEPIDPAAADALLAPLTTPTDTEWPAPDSAGPVWWLHVEQPGGYLVGRFHDGHWTLAAPDGTALPCIDTAWEQIRIFQPDHEIILVADGNPVRGIRRVRIPSPESPTSYRMRELVLEHQPPTTRPGTVFPVIVDPDTGLSFVAPEPRTGESTVQMQVREHFTADPLTGAVRVAVVCWDHYSGGISEQILTAHTAAVSAAAKPGPNSPNEHSTSPAQKPRRWFRRNR